MANQVKTMYADIIENAHFAYFMARIDFATFQPVAGKDQPVPETSFRILLSIPAYAEFFSMMDGMAQNLVDKGLFQRANGAEK